jgi:integrase/recombinase XerD
MGAQKVPHRSKASQEEFVAEAVAWLSFMNRLQTPPKPLRPHEQVIGEFGEYMRKDRGLSPATVDHRCHVVRSFLDQLLSAEQTLDAITVGQIDSLLVKKVNEAHYARASVRSYASSLRSFFRFAQMRGWCTEGIAASIMAPRAFQHETLPSGPPWDVVQEMLNTTSGDHPTAIRDHAILIVFALYGVRSSEVARLRLSDIDWEKGTIVFRRAKVGGSHVFPLHDSAGASIFRYLKEVRPMCACREVFLTRHAPIGPLSGGAMWAVVARQLRDRALSIAHHGPHSLRHYAASGTMPRVGVRAAIHGHLNNGDAA